MLVLLPPSEGKASPEAGGPRAEGGTGDAALDLGVLSLPGLTAAREEVLDALVGLCSGDEGKAREVLGLGEKLRGEVAKNAALRTAPARPAGEIYTGVLYDALDLATLDNAATQRAEHGLLIFSGLWGAVRIGDPIPSYRCSGGVKLPGVGALGTYWQGPMAEVMPRAAGGGLVLDLRSAAYGKMWKRTGEQAQRTVTVRVLQSKTVGGVEKRSVVSHFNKATKGRIVRDLLTEGAEPGTPAELAEVLRGLGYAVEGPASAGASAGWRLDVVVTELRSR